MERVYLVTMSLLITHQIDAAYWHEWEMFLLPGGIQGYLAFNIIALPILLIGYKNVITNTAKAVSFSYLCAGLGALTFLIHSVFLLLGFEQFKTPLSLMIILLCLFSSIWLILHTRKPNNYIKKGA